MEIEQKVTKRVLEMFEEIWLKDSDFIGGFNSITIADIAAVCEATQLYLMGYDFSPFPKVNAWIKRCLETTGLKKAHGPFFKVLKKLRPEAKL